MEMEKRLLVEAMRQLDIKDAATLYQMVEDGHDADIEVRCQLRMSKLLEDVTHNCEVITRQLDDQYDDPLSEETLEQVVVSFTADSIDDWMKAVEGVSYQLAMRGDTYYALAPNEEIVIRPFRR